MKNDVDNIKLEIRKVISEVLGVSEDVLSGETNFVADLSMDSLSVLEIIAAVEKRFGMMLPDEEIRNVTTLGDVYRIVENAAKPDVN